MGSIIQPRSRNWVTGDAQAEFDNATAETILRYSTVYFEDDFIGPGHTTIPAQGSPSTGYPWVKRTQQTSGVPTVAIVNNQPGGLVQLALDATSEKQEASLYSNDQLNYDGSKSAQFECRLAMSVIPTGVVEAVFGLRAAWIDGPDNAAEYIDFQMLSSGAVNCRIKDGVTGAQSYASGITLVAAAFHNFRFDATDPTNVGFYIDGVKVSPVAPLTLPTFAATGASAILQPYFSVYKASGTGVGSMQLDMVQLAMNRL